MSAMETAGKEDMPEDAERKGLGLSLIHIYFSYLKKNGKIESIDEAKFQNIANPNDFIDEQVRCV